MLKGKRHLPTYNDGVVGIYAERERKTDFSAKRNVTKREDMDLVVALAFQECSKRTQDLEFAEQSGFSLSYKVKTHHRPEVRVKHKAVINGYLYEVSYIDKAGAEMYLYLEGVRQLDPEQD